MQSQRFLPALLLAAVFCLAACTNTNQNNGNDADTATVKPSSTTTPSTANTRPSTIITTPQLMLIVMHRVANYARWKPAYEAHDTARRAAGIHNYVIGRGLQDSNMIMVAMKVDDSARAMAFTQRPDLKAAMQQGGVVGTPTISLVNIVFQDTARMNNDLRSSTMLNVKDWASWYANFQTGHQERLDNGLAVRAYGYEAGNNRKVRVVTALVDSAKAVAFFASDAIKKRMQASGVIGQPERFLFRVVQRY